MADVLDRIRKLIALAASPNENEARNASFLAVKMIREHKIQLSLESESHAPPAMDMDIFWRSWGRRGHPPKRERAKPDEVRTDAYNRPWEFYLYSPVTDNCTYCGGVVHRGTPVMTLREDAEVQHERCWEVSNPRKRKPNAKDFDISSEELDDLFK